MVADTARFIRGVGVVSDYGIGGVLVSESYLFRG